MSLIPNAVLEPAQRPPLGLGSVLTAGAMRLLREAIEARAGMVTGVRQKP
jgi:hypothetical protein